MRMTSKQRMLTAIKGSKPDRLPVTTHHVMPYFLKNYMNNISTEEFFDHFGLDPILWGNPVIADTAKGQFITTIKMANGWPASFVCSDNWRIESVTVEGQDYPTSRFNFVTPRGSLSMVIQFNEYTCWVVEHLIKNKRDIDLIGDFGTAPLCSIEEINQIAGEYGQRGLVRGHICCFDVFGQPGTWQDAACLYGIQKLIMETYDDPAWVHELLRILHNRKKIYIKSLKGASYDILELGGGDASSSVISPQLFDDFVLPYDSELIKLAHGAGQRIVYHTCGGMMPILENIAAMKPDAMETFTPVGMGGDVDLAEARMRVPKDICMIGGFDQFHFFTGCTAEQTRAEVRRCFEAAGRDGGFILCPSDHFFDADPKLIAAFADETQKCVY